MYTDYYSITGSEHELHRIPCEDVGAVFETEDLTVVAVSDGCSAYPNTDIAAELTIRGLNEFVHQHEKVIIQGRFSPDRFMKMLLIKLKHLYKEHCGKYPYHYMAATLAFLIINRTNDCYHLFSVGDSTVLSVDCLGRVSVRMAPYNKNITSTVFCNSYEEAKSTYQYGKGNLSEDGRAAFLLLTDGAAAAPHYAYGELIQSLSKHDVFERRIILKDFCKNLKNKTGDDITVALIMPEEVPTATDSDKKYEGGEEERNPFKELLNALKTPISVRELCEKGIYPEGHLLAALMPMVSAGMAVKIKDKDEIKYRLSDDMMKAWFKEEGEEA